jgi:AcrR family transcriptional regulator
VERNRRDQLLELAYAYALEHGLGGISLRPLAAAIGSSPRVLLFLFDSKEGIVRALLARARADELELLDSLGPVAGADLAPTALAVWDWIADPRRHGLMRLWLESYARSLVEPDGPWAAFARDTVDDWLGLLGRAQPAGTRAGADLAQRTLVLAVLRGALIDLLATGELERTTDAVMFALERGLTDPRP